MSGTPTGEAAEERSVLSSSAVMAAGTTFSRLSGFIRSVLLAAALGNLVHADVFTIANTIPARPTPTGSSRWPRSSWPR